MAIDRTPPITETEYTYLIDAADSQRERVILALTADAGLRTQEVTNVCYADIKEPPVQSQGAVLVVADRCTFLPPTACRVIDQYIAVTDRPATAPLIDVSARRVQMLIDELTTRAAEQTAVDHLRSVTAQDLRHRFAYHALRERNVSLRIVKAAGGWDSRGPLEEYLSPVTESELVTAFRRSSTTHNELLVAIVRALLDANSPAAIANTVCTTLTEQSEYKRAWLAEHEQSGSVRILATAGIEPEQLSSTRVDSVPWTDALAASTVQVVESTVVSGPVIAVPVVYRDLTIGTLVVQPTSVTDVQPNTVLDARRQNQLSLAGQQIARTIAATRRRRLLESDAVTELEFHSKTDHAPLVRLGRAVQTPLSLHALVPSDANSLLCYLEIETGDPAAVVDHADAIDAIDEYRLVEQGPNGALFEFGLTGPSLASVLIDAGATVDALSVTDGIGEVIATVPEGSDIRGLVGAVRSAFPETEFVGKRTRETPPTPMTGNYTGIIGGLTDRQQAVLRAAFFGGYFDWPRGSTAEEIADSMDVSSPTFHRHLRQGLHTLLESVLEETN